MPPPDRIARRILVSGGGQGVGYRAFARRAAEALALTGWVRNLADGRVEAVAEGPLDAVMAFVESCRAGPRLSAVSEIRVEDHPWIEAPRFEVRPSA